MEWFFQWRTGPQEVPLLGPKFVWGFTPYIDAI